MNERAAQVDMIKSMIEGKVTAGDEIIYSKGKFSTRCERTKTLSWAGLDT